MIKKYNLNVNLSKDLITNKSNISCLKRYTMFKKNILYHFGTMLVSFGDDFGAILG